MTNRIIEIDTLTAYPASCLVRDEFNRPKTLVYGGVERGRVSSQAIKRAVRTSEIFEAALAGDKGVRSRRALVDVYKKLEAEVGKTAAKTHIERVLKQFGKADDKLEGATKQLAYLSNEEIAKAAAVVGKIAAGEEVGDAEIEAILGTEVSAADIALFGRMFADRGELKMTAALAVAHPFTVAKASVESDFYVAKDDLSGDDETGAGFMGRQEFLSGLFYGYWRLDADQLLRNLGGDVEKAVAAVAALIAAVPQTTPTGKSAAFGTDARASWVQVRVSANGLGSLAAAFLAPVVSTDQLGESKRLLANWTEGIARGYGIVYDQRQLDVAAGTGTISELATFGAAAVLGS